MHNTKKGAFSQNLPVNYIWVGLHTYLQMNLTFLGCFDRGLVFAFFIGAARRAKNHHRTNEIQPTPWITFYSHLQH